MIELWTGRDRNGVDDESSNVAAVKTLFAIGIAIAIAVAVSTSAAGAKPASGIEGRILDTTCRGPCSPGTVEPRPYRGPAEVVIRTRDRGQAATVATEDGRFRKRLRPSRYRLHAVIDDPCWESDAVELKVHRDEFEQVRLLALNTCVL